MIGSGPCDSHHTLFLLICLLHPLAEQTVNMFKVTAFPHEAGSVHCLFVFAKKLCPSCQLSFYSWDSMYMESFCMLPIHAYILVKNKYLKMLSKLEIVKNSVVGVSFRLEIKEFFTNNDIAHSCTPTITLCLDLDML